MIITVSYMDHKTGALYERNKLQDSWRVGIEKYVSYVAEHMEKNTANFSLKSGDYKVISMISKPKDLIIYVLDMDEVETETLRKFKKNDLKVYRTEVYQYLNETE